MSELKRVMIIKDRSSVDKYRRDNGSDASNVEIWII